MAKDVRVLLADKEEIHKGWVRISENKRRGIASGSYVKLSRGRRSVFTQVRGTPGETSIIKMSEWYRNSLGWDDPPQGLVDLELNQKALFCELLRKLFALISHPDDSVRTSIGLAFISLTLGFLGVSLALLSISLSVASPVAFWPIIAFLAFLALVLLGFGIKAILKSAPKLTNSS